MSNKGFTYTLNIDAEIKDLLSKTETVKKSMQSIMDAGKAPGAEKIFKSIENALDKLQQKAAQPITSIAGFNNLQKEAIAISAQLGKLGDTIKNLSNLSDEEKLELIPPDLKSKIDAAKRAIASYIEVYSKTLEKTEDMIKADKELADAKKKLQEVQGKASEVKQLVDLQQKNVEAAKNEAKAIKDKQAALEKFLATQKEYEKTGADKRSSLDTNSGKINYRADKNAAAKLVPSVDLSSVQAIEQEIQKLKNEYKDASKAVTDAEANQRKYEKSLTDSNNKVTVAQASVNNLTNTVDKLNNEFEQNNAKKLQSAYTALRNEAQKLGVDISNIPIDYTEQNLIQLSDTMLILKQQGMDAANAGIAQMKSSFEEFSSASSRLGSEIKSVGTKVRQMDETVKNSTAFTSRIAQFVGLQGAIQIARRAMQNAMSTIKELDAAMTEMAVVTDLGVGDYWDQLPEYTARANALGVSIKSAYESATLYYQQGLKTNEVVAMSNETLKMMRIAGLSAEDATNKMTAALRGFNMELNETSAQRVADVYSKLAAITASDVKEISSAMTKTASIASSAGMEFETTAAFLSQIIETTRESAETAGTALKTVIARFQELKKDPAEIGEVDGEVVDANKIETALRSVGVALRDTTGQFRDLDDVFLELAGKWDSLDTNTQRYVATIAAGSRQQSRFIAMMSDYGRTQELVTAANNSAGASNEQFEKTLDSIWSKLNELKNAWASFTMGIMNSDLLKKGIDILTGILTAFNNFTDSLGKFSGAAKIGLLVAALYLGDKALHAFRQSLSEGKTVLQSLGTTGKGTFALIKKDIEALKQKMKEYSASISVAKDRMAYLNNQEQINSVKRYHGALQNLARANKEVQDIEAKGITKGALHDRVMRGQANATQSLNIATDKLKIAFDLTDDEMNEAIFLASQGIKIDKAAILVKNEKAAAILREKAALNGLNKEEKEKLMIETADSLLSKTDAADNINGLANSLQNLGTKMRNFDLKKWFSGVKDGFKQLGRGIANVARQIWSFIASCWPYIVVILAVAAAIAALVLYIKHLQKTSPEGKLKSAKAAAEQASKAADEAAESYNQLNESLNSLNDKYKGLEELTKDTKEWRDAVRSINDEVLDLITEYPELAGMFENVDGVLTIKAGMEDDVEAVLKEKEIKATAASSAEIASKVAVLRAEQEVAYKNLSHEAKYGRQQLVNAATWGGAGVSAAGGAVGGAFAGSAIPGIGNVVGAVAGAIISGITGGIAAHAGITAAFSEYEDNNEDITKDLARAMANGDIDDPYDVEQVSEWMQEKFGLAADMADKWAGKLHDSTEELIEFGRALNQSDEQTKMYYETIAQNAAQLVDTFKMTAEQQKQINVAANAAYGEAFVNLAQKELDEKKNKEEKAALKEYAESLGWEDVKVKTNRITYTDAEGKEQEIDRELFENQYAAAKGTEKAVKALEKLPSAISTVAGKIGGEAGKAFKQSYAAAEGGALTLEQSNALKDYVEDGEQLKIMWGSLSSTEKEAFGNIDNFKKQLDDSVKLSQNAFNKAQENLTELANGAKLSTGMTADSAKGYIKQLENIGISAGEKGVNAINNAIRAMDESLSDEEFNKLMGQINALDWKNLEDWESLPETLKAIGVSVPSKQLNAFIEAAKESAGAIHKVDLTKLTEEIQKLANLKNKIVTKEQGRTFSQADYESLIASDSSLASSFAQTLSGEYVYLGSSLDALTEAINNNTDALLKEAKDQLEDKITAAKVMGSDIKDWNTLSDNKQKQYLKDLVKSLRDQDVNLDNLGIDYLTNNISNDGINKLFKDKDKFNAVMNGLVGIFTTQEDNENLYNAKTLNASILSALDNDAFTNAKDAQRARESIEKNGQLSDSDWNDLEVGARALVAQAVEAGANEIDTSAYSTIIEKMREVEAGFKEGSIDGKEYSAQMRQLSKEAENYEKKLTDIVNRNTMNTYLANTISAFNEFGENFDKLVSESDKLELVATALDNFGIKVTESNYQQYADMLKTIAAGGEGSYEAFVTLIQEAAKSYSISIDDIAKLTTDGWDKTTIEMSVEMTKFVEDMKILGGGMWGELANGAEGFSIVFSGALEQAINMAGTLQEEMESAFDWLYNSDAKLSTVQRKQEAAEREYERAKNSGASDEELRNIAQKQVSLIGEEAGLQQERASQASQEIAKRLSVLDKRVLDAVSFDDTGRLFVDEAKYGALPTELKTALKEFEADYTKNYNIMLEAQDSLEGLHDETMDIEKEVSELDEPDLDAISELMDEIKEGLIKMRQDAIDELQNNTDAINEAESAMYDQIQKQIDSERKNRSNQKTEKELSDKQARLAYLRRDSGANAVEIAALEKEIAEGQESYQDTLIDQALQDLQDANEKAAEQRQEQIDIMQDQLDAYAESEQIWKDVQAILDGDSAKIIEIAKYGAKIESMNPLEQTTWYDGLDSKITAYKEYAFGDGSTSGAFNKALSNTTSSIVTAIEKVVTAISGIKSKASESTVSNDQVEQKLVETAPKTREEIVAETFKETGDYIKFKVNAGEVINNTWMGANGQRYLAYGDKWLAEDKDGAKQGFSYDSKTGIMTIYKDSALYSTEALGGAHLDQEEIEGFEWMDFLEIIESILKESLFEVEEEVVNHGGGRSLTGLGAVRNIHFATGGLADFTGPAWLDGTKSRPELVLNQQDTANFIQLKDILSDILTGTSSITNNKPAGASGDNYFDIDISVENIEDDYDVEQMAEKIKDMIYEDATYRNVNTINAIS